LLGQDASPNGDLLLDGTGGDEPGEGVIRHVPRIGFDNDVGEIAAGTPVTLNLLGTTGVAARTIPPNVVRIARLGCHSLSPVVEAGETKPAVQNDVLQLSQCLAVVRVHETTGQR
jgi:hypothetical protein